MPKTGVMLSIFLTGDAVTLNGEKAKLLFMLNLHIMAWELLNFRAKDLKLPGSRRRRVRNQEKRGKKMTKKTIALVGLALAGMVGTWSANAAPIEINWCGATTPFDTSECTFGSVGPVDSLTQISSDKGQYTAYQSNTGGTNFYMDLRLGDTWVNVWSAFHNPASDTSFLISDTIAPLSFGLNTLSGIRFYTDFPNPPKEYKFFDIQSTKFTFACSGQGCDPNGGDDDDTTPVPEPGTLALLGIGLAGLGLSRRKGSKKS